MEFTTEINKIFGEEMAKLFAAQISDNELLEEAQKVWNNLTKIDYNPAAYYIGGSGSSRESELEKLIKNEFLIGYITRSTKSLKNLCTKRSLRKKQEKWSIMQGK